MKIFFGLCAILALALSMFPPKVGAQIDLHANAAVVSKVGGFDLSGAVSPAAVSTSSITHCGQTLEANMSYTLSTNIGSDLTAQCLRLAGPNLSINLNGFTIKGTLKGLGVNANGLHIYNGTILCQDDSTSSPGCIYVNADATAISAITEIDHLNVQNTSNTSANSERNVMLDFGSIAKTTITGPNIKIHDNVSTSATGLSSSRIVNLQVQGTAHSNAAYPEFYNNTTTCKSTAAACQGIVAYGIYNTKIHNNTVNNQLSSPTSTETPRGVLCDQTDGCEIFSNVFDAEDGRAVRMRGTSPKHGPNSAHDNTVKNVVAGSNQNHVAAFHIGDPDSGTEVENATITKNTIYFTSGQIFMVRSATGVTLTGNTAVGTGTINMLDLRYDGSPSSASLTDTSLVGGQGMSFCASNTSGKVCKSGNVSGVCSLNNSGC